MVKQLLTEQYDSLYASVDAYSFGGGNLVPAVLRLPEYVAKGSVLDVGGGDGRHALALAKLGYAVTVVDLSSVGLKKLQKKATAEQLAIKTQVADVCTDAVAGTYDAIVCTFVLHHMDAAVISALIARLQQQTVVGGVHVLATFLNQGGLAERNKKSQSGRYYPTLEALQSLYIGWEIVESFSHTTTTLAKDKTGAKMRNEMGVVVAKKLA